MKLGKVARAIAQAAEDAGGMVGIGEIYKNVYAMGISRSDVQIMIEVLTEWGIIERHGYRLTVAVPDVMKALTEKAMARSAANEQ